MSNKKKHQVYGIGNAIVDVLIEVSDAELFSATELVGGAKGRMNLLEKSQIESLLKLFNQKEQLVQSGGSVANSLAAIGMTEGSAVFGGLVCSDKYGEIFSRELNDVEVSIFPKVEISSTNELGTGVSVVLITSDGERTMFTNLGVNTLFGSSAEHISPVNEFNNLEYLFIEGYLFYTENGRQAIQTAVDFATKQSAKIAVTLSDVLLVRGHRSDLLSVLNRAYLIIGNEGEFNELAQTDDFAEVIKRVSKIAPNFVVTKGGKGVYLYSEDCEGFVPAQTVEVLDTTGAGDAFAGAFLSFLSTGTEACVSAKRACYFAGQVVSCRGPRLGNDYAEVVAKCEEIVT